MEKWKAVVGGEMKILILIILGSCLVGCTDTPQYLREQEDRDKTCTEACAPRKYRSYDPFFGCHCKLDK